MTLTLEQLAELKRLDAAAAKGPWSQHLVDDTTIIDQRARFIASACGGDDDLAEADYNNPDEWPVMEANIELITAMRNALPALIAAAEREARAKAATDTALGYMMSASVALGAGATKAQAIETMNNGMARIRAALAGDA